MVTFLLPIIIANHDISYKECTIFAFAIDNIYSLITKNLLLSFSFEKNLLTYYLCANKLVCILNASCGSEGSYSTILNFIADHPTEGVNVPSSKDVVTFFFNNNQMPTRNWRIHLDAKAILNAITTVIHFFPFLLYETTRNPPLVSNKVALRLLKLYE